MERRSVRRNRIRKIMEKKNPLNIKTYTHDTETFLVFEVKQRIYEDGSIGRMQVVPGKIKRKSLFTGRKLALGDESE